MFERSFKVEGCSRGRCHLASFGSHPTSGLSFFSFFFLFFGLESGFGYPVGIHT